MRAAQIILLATFICTCTSEGGKSGPGDQRADTGVKRREITVRDIEKDIVGKSVGEGLKKWEFRANEPRDMKIENNEYSGDIATMEVQMTTVGGPSLGIPVVLSGQLRLHYEWIANKWVLRRVESLSFERQ